MTLFIQNLKVAFRNLVKYKLQTLISVLSIAIGIVTLALAHSVMKNIQLPAVYAQPFNDRAYSVRFKTVSDGKWARNTTDVIRALKQDGGPRSAEMIAIAGSGGLLKQVDFQLSDSSTRKGQLTAEFIDNEYLSYAGIESAITGKRIDVLKPGEAIISEELAKRFFHGKNPIGAIQTLTGPDQPIPVTIVDVYKSVTSIDKQSVNSGLYFCLADKVEDSDLNYHYVKWINIVLKEGEDKQQLLEELNKRVEPFGYTAEISKALNQEDIGIFIAVKGLIYLISSLILIAAVIGFLRIQSQLFMLRRRELTIRLVNGANRLKLFGLLVVETAIPILLSVFLAVLFGYLLQFFLDGILDTFLQNNDFFFVRMLWPYSLAIGACLLFICVFIIWCILWRIIRSTQGIAANMRKNRKHRLRNIMLGIQIFISLVFVCATFITVRGVNEIVKASNVPDDDELYKECLYLNAGLSLDSRNLIGEIKRLPALERLLRCEIDSYRILEVESDPKAAEAFRNRYQYVFETYRTDDPALLSFYQMDVEWLNRDVDRNECVLISENLYRQLEEFGLTDQNFLNIVGLNSGENLMLPIGGIIKKMAYDYANESLVAVSPFKETNGDVSCILVPKYGKGKDLAREVEDLIDDLEPENMNDLISDFRSMTNTKLIMAETLRKGSWILGVVSLIVCAMSILSIVALDTRARRKEVAIRKVNGAKSGDIYRLFGRVYVLLILVSLLLGIPLCFLFNHLIGMMVESVSPERTLSPLWPILIGCLTVILLVFAIVFWQIRRVMQTDPAKIIAKE